MDVVFGSITGVHEQETLPAVKEEVGLTALLRGGRDDGKPVEESKNWEPERMERLA